MAVISFAFIAKLICVFVSAYAKVWFYHDPAHMSLFIQVHVFYISRGADPAVILGGNYYHLVVGRSTSGVWSAMDAHYILYL